MDTSDPEISFDDSGNCSHCTDYMRRAEAQHLGSTEREIRLANIVSLIKQAGKGRDYDCIIGVSGGVDSTYVAYTVKKLGLRPLAVHLDNGWDSALAVKNIERIVQKLKVDLYTHVLDWDEFKDLQLAFLKASTPDSEIPTDHAIHAVLLQQAHQHGLQYIIGGSNMATEGIMPLAWSQGIRDWKYISSVHARFGSHPLRSFPHFTISDLLYYHAIKRLKFVYILNFLPYVKSDAMRTIQEELGWVYYGGKHYESVYTRFFQAYILPRKFGFDKRRGHLSTLICSGQLTREEALRELEREICPEELLSEDRQFVIKKLGITEVEFEAIMAAPQRRFVDFPSYENSLFFGPLVNGYRWLRNRGAQRTAGRSSAPGQIVNSRQQETRLGSAAKTAPQNISRNPVAKS